MASKREIFSPQFVFFATGQRKMQAMQILLCMEHITVIRHVRGVFLGNVASSVKHSLEKVVELKIRRYLKPIYSSARKMFS